MQKQTLTFVVALLTFFTVYAQANRTFDGSNNNLEHPEWGAAHTNLLRATDLAYSNGWSSLAGTNRPNPRAISNALFSQAGILDEPRNLSCYLWTFGQFLDHDISLTADAQDEFAMIDVPMGDPWFDPHSTGAVRIPMRRSEFDPNTSTSVINPRQHPNRISSFIDGSAVYGPDETFADWLRTFNQGKLKTSAGDLLPFNTTTGELEDPIDSNAPHMEDAVGASPKLFVAGDVRVNENILLTAFHTLFVREHNRLCDEIALENPTWSDEEIYQYARKLNSGFIQSITYNEFLPSLGIHLPEYDGYKPEVNPSVMNIFSGAAYRLHSLINQEILRLDNDGNVIPQGHATLREAFFNPMEVIEGGGLDPLFKGMAALVAQDYDNKMIDDIRNFLFGDPGAGGLDLAAININRGRERGFPDFNTVRANFGLTPYSSIDEITSNEEIVAILEDLYGGDVNNIDPFVGFVVEDHMNDDLLGETVLTILARQFLALRDGDRYFYFNDPVLTEEEKNMIDNTRLVDIIMRNTDVKLMQGDLFAAMEHSTLVDCDAEAPNLAIQGTVQTATGLGIGNVAVHFDGSRLIQDIETPEDGVFLYETVPSCYDYTLAPYCDDNPVNGVSTYDLVLIQSHILGISPLDSPYKIIAADANNDGNITTFDVVQLRQLILHIIDAFPTNTSWRFIDASYAFGNATNPLEVGFPENIEIQSLNNDVIANFIGIKIGDVDHSATPGDGANANDQRNNLTDKLIFSVKDRSFVEGQTFSVPFRAQELRQIIGYQFTLNYDASALELVDIETGKLRNLGSGNFGVFAEEGIITTSWNGSNEMRKEDVVFTLHFKAKTHGNLRDQLSINSRLTRKEAISTDLQLWDVALQFEEVEGMDEPLLVSDKFEVYQNFPNPFKETTMLGFYLPKASQTTITINDANGRTVYVSSENFAAGYQRINLDRKILGSASGVLYYEVKTDFGTVSKKMILVD